MRETTMDILLRMGIPASVKGLTYICDAVELFDTDPYYPDGKICSLYMDIAKKNNTTASRVERAIRHAFETALTKGNQELLDKYLDTANTKNSNLLRSLYFRLQMEYKKTTKRNQCSAVTCEIKKQIYQEAMEVFHDELELALQKLMDSVESGYMMKV